MTIDWNEVHSSGKQYTAMPDAVLNLVLTRAGNPKSVLDIACGTGDLLVKLARRGLSVTGTDVSSVALAKAREALNAAGLQAALIEADMNASGFAQKLSGHYDAVIIRLSLAFVHDRDTFLEEVRLLLSAGGVFICTTPVLLDGGEYDARQQNISIPQGELDALLAKNFEAVELVVPNELDRPEWPLVTYMCRQEPVGAGTPL